MERDDPGVSGIVKTRIILNAYQNELLVGHIKRGSSISELLTDESFMGQFRASNLERAREVISDSFSLEGVIFNFNRGLVYALARNYPQLSDEEVLAAGSLGLLSAAERLDPEKGSYITFASWYVRAELQRAVRRSYTLTRSIVAGLVLIDRVQEAILAVTKAEPEEADIRQCLLANTPLSVSRVDELMMIRASQRALSISMSHNEGVELGAVQTDMTNQVVDVEAVAISNADESGFGDKMERAISLLEDPRQRTIINRLYSSLDNQPSLQDLAAELNITVSTIQELHTSALIELQQNQELLTMTNQEVPVVSIQPDNFEEINIDEGDIGWDELSLREKVRILKGKGQSNTEIGSKILKNRNWVGKVIAELTASGELGTWRDFIPRIAELRTQGLSIRKITDQTGLDYNRVRRVITELEENNTVENHNSRNARLKAEAVSDMTKAVQSYMESITTPKYVAGFNRAFDQETVTKPKLPRRTERPISAEEYELLLIKILDIIKNSDKGIHHRDLVSLIGNVKANLSLVIRNAITEGLINRTYSGKRWFYTLTEKGYAKISE